MDQANRILIIDDDRKMVAQLDDFLSQQGYQVEAAYDGQEGLDKALKNQADVVLLDWMMPGLNGIDVCRELRKYSNVPIIMLTAKGNEADKVVGLELGADDYMSKPFGLMELQARIRGQMRRRQMDKTEAEEQAQDCEELSFPHFSVNYGRRELLVDNVMVELTRSEFDLLWLLASNPGRVYSRDKLLDHISGGQAYAQERAVDMHMSNLRRKIEPNVKKPTYIKTAWGVGYSFNAS